MTHGSLFSGIGGFDLAAEWAGWYNKFHCEWNEFGKRVLNHYWPEAISYHDITKTDFTIWRGRIDVLTGGFPCQPYSMAGKRLGKEDERHLWPEMLRVIREVKPTWIVGENVSGLINWSGGLVFDEVQADLEGAGYEVRPFVLPSAGVNAPHRRERIWFIAHTNGNGQQRSYGENEINTNKTWFDAQCDIEHGFEFGTASNTNSKRLQREPFSGSSGKSGEESDKQLTRLFRTTWESFPTQPPVCNGNDGIPAKLDGITFSKWRAESVKAAGNAIVPQVAYQIFKSINEYEHLNS